ncbi:hypothetical protein [Dactylosporangium sp. CA-139066]|uniref:hypothetical protein n=1 Tax=Dactylosporangium sp. CA-139066 TaxID=3239930 RepID=UPI003D91B816
MQRRLPVADEVRAEVDVVAGEVAVVPAGAETWRAPGLSHILRAQPGPATMRTYRKDMRRPIDPALTARITDWLARH